MFKSKHKLFAASALLAATGAAHAAIFTIGDTSGSAPSSIPTFNVLAGGQLTFSLWGQGQGTGYLVGASLGVYASTAPSFAGGVVSASNTLPAPSSTLISSPTNTYSAHALDQTIFSSSSSPQATNTTQVTGAQVVIANMGGNNLSRPANAISAGAAALISTITGTVTATPGTYYLYLGRVGSGISESPVVKEAGFIGGQGSSASVTNTTRFGFGDTTPVASAGSGVNGTVANTLSPSADAIIVVAPVGNTTPSLSLSAGVTAPTTIPGTAQSYVPTLLAANDQFALGGTPDAAGHTLVAFDFSGGADYSSFFKTLPDGAVQLSGAEAAKQLAAFNGTLGGSFDVVIDLGANKPTGTLGIDLTGSGVTLNAVAAVPEPTTVSLAGIGAVLAMSRRRRQTA